MLEQVRQLVEKEGYQLHNADITIIAQKPKLLPYLSAMRANLSQALKLEEARINIKATTTEKLGFCRKGRRDRGRSRLSFI